MPRGAHPHPLLTHVCSSVDYPWQQAGSAGLHSTLPQRRIPSQQAHSLGASRPDAPDVQRGADQHQTLQTPGMLVEEKRGQRAEGRSGRRGGWVCA